MVNLFCAVVFWRAADYYFMEELNFLGWSSLVVSAANAAAFMASVV